MKPIPILFIKTHQNSLRIDHIKGSLHTKCWSYVDTQLHSTLTTQIIRQLSALIKRNLI